VQPPLLAVRGAVDVYNQAIALVLRELDAMDEGDQVRAQLASFADANGLALLFGGAGPADDGTLNAARIAENVSRMGPIAEQALARQLHEYASYALFLARPHLRRAEGKARISQRVTTLLEPISASKIKL
jgi:hypothetical protein